jgi:hypothetical protein
MKIGHFKNVQKRVFLLAFPKKIKKSRVTEMVTIQKCDFQFVTETFFKKILKKQDIF